MAMDRVDHQGMHRYIFVIPQATVRQRCIIATGVNRAIAGVDDAPAAFSADFAHGRTGVRHLIAGPECVRRLVKAIRCGHGADPDRVEKDIVAGISTH